MGLPPTGKIVERVMVARICGCLQEFQHYAVDKFRPQRLAKFQRTRCPACAAKLAEGERRAAALPKGEALKLLPPGTQVSLTLGPEGAWLGTLVAGGKAVETVGVAGAGPGAVVVSLARLWASESATGQEQSVP